MCLLHLSLWAMICTGGEGLEGSYLGSCPVIKLSRDIGMSRVFSSPSTLKMSPWAADEEKILKYIQAQWDIASNFGLSPWTNLDGMWLQVYGSIIWAVILACFGAPFCTSGWITMQVTALLGHAFRMASMYSNDLSSKGRCTWKIPGPSRMLNYLRYSRR